MNTAVLPSRAEFLPATQACPQPTPRPQRPRGYRRVRSAAYFSALFLIAFVAAEIGARVDDWAHDGVPPLANPSPAYDLQVQNADGIVRGRPNGRYKRWQLNEHGFRSPPMSQEPAPGRVRVAVLGASETFGLYESNGAEMPAQLARELQDETSVEVFNASITGMTVRSMLPYWEGWVSDFRPRIVVLYASPLFYLRDSAIKPIPESVAAAPRKSEGELRPVVAEPGLNSRFVSRLKDSYHFPDWIQRHRNRWEIERLSQDKPADWYYRSAPAANLARFRADIDALTQAIRASGAEVVVVTHAVRAESPPRPDDLDDLQSMRTHLPQATPETLVAFNQEASAALLDMCRENGMPSLDAAAALNGKRELYGDLVHFNDAGASALARLVAERVRPLVQETRAAAKPSR